MTKDADDTTNARDDSTDTSIDTSDSGADDVVQRRDTGEGDAHGTNPDTENELYGHGGSTDGRERGADRSATDSSPNEEFDSITGDGPGDPFELIDMDRVDEYAVWTDLVGDDGDGPTSGDIADHIAGADGDRMESAIDVRDDEAVVPKGSYCEQCEHFADPPETACTHSGTEIRELVDVDHFRVSNCPIVERRQQIGRSTED